MLVPLSWLGDFVPLEAFFGPGGVPVTGPGLRRLTETLDSLGLVVERVTPVPGDLPGVVLARVVEIGPIKGADRIRRVLVDAGGNEPVEVVCGAWNFGLGDVVPLATVGTTLPGGMRIERRALRGVTSNGMLCSSAELELATDAAGILVLERGVGDGAHEAAAGAPGALALGQPLAEHLGLRPDVVLDLAVEPNRPDALCILGVARDLAAMARLPLTVPTPQPVEAGPPAAGLARAEVAAPEACERLVVRVVEQLVPVASPPQVQRRLVLAGMRPISAVVDATNYVMLELGQPTHAYDLDRLGGGGIAVRLARPGEQLVTLDGVERHLGQLTLPVGAAAGADPRQADVRHECVVADLDDHVVGLAGVMGGAATEVSATTTRVLLEAAAFEPRRIVRSARHHGLRSEASVRFERGIDPEGLVRAADRVVELVAAAAAAAGAPAPLVAAGVVDVRAVARPARRIFLRTDRLNGVLGTALAAEEAAGCLEPIGFTTSPLPGGLEVTVPSFRPDVTLEVDVVEEVARHYGYERIAGTPRRAPGVGRLSDGQVLRRRLRRLLTGAGVDEAWTSSIVDPTVARRLEVRAGAVALANPMVAEESALRTHLLPGLLDALRRNVSRQNDDVRLFELGAVFAARPTAPATPGPAGDGLLQAHVEERELVGVLLGAPGDDASAAVACWWRLVDGLGLDPDALALDQPRLRAGAAAAEDRAGRGDGDRAGGGAGEGLVGDLLAGCHPSRAAWIRQGSGSSGRCVGALGEVDPSLLATFDLPPGRRVGWLVCDVAGLLATPRRSPLARPVSRYPSSDVDLAFVLAEARPADDLVAVVREAAGDLGEAVAVLDAYRAGAGAGTRSVTVRTRLRALERTLSDQDVAAFRSAAIALAAERLGAILRA